jgi:acyl carrier protein
VDEDAARSVIAEHLAVSPEQVTDDARFLDLGADSLDLITLTMDLEVAFDVQVSDEAATGCETVGDALGVLRAAALLRAQPA